MDGRDVLILRDDKDESQHKRNRGLSDSLGAKVLYLDRRKRAEMLPETFDRSMEKKKSV